MKLLQLLNRLHNLKVVRVIHLDFDNWESFETFRSIIIALKYFGPENVRLIRSSSGASLQLKIILPEPISIADLVLIYLLLGSDPYRARFVLKRNLNATVPVTDVSFIKKKYYDYGVGHRMELDIAEILPEWEQALDPTKEENIYKLYLERLSKYMKPIPRIVIEFDTEKQFNEFLDKFPYVNIKKRINLVSKYCAIVIIVHNHQLLNDIISYLENKGIKYKIYEKMVKQEED